MKERTQMDRPREKAMLQGIERLENQDLLCLVLGSGTKTHAVESLAQSILQKTDNLRRLYSIAPEELMEIEGIGQAKALQICAARELYARSLQARTMSVSIRSLDDIETWLQAEYGTKSQEHFAVLYLDVKRRIIRHKDLFVGTLDQSLIHPREIFRDALMTSASSIVLVHNHPSGDPIPSLADLESTQMLLEAARLHKISLLDHVIATRNGCFSFRSHGLLDQPESEYRDLA